MRKCLWTLLLLVACDGASGPREATSSLESVPSEPVADVDELAAIGISVNSYATCEALESAQLAEAWDVAAREVLEAMNVACVLPPDGLMADQAEETLGEQPVAIETEGDVFTLYQRMTAESLDGLPPGVRAGLPEGAPYSCCTFQKLDMADLANGEVWGVRLRVQGLDEAMIQQFAIGMPGELADYRGPSAPPRVEPVSEIEGTVSEHELFSPQLGETRRISVYRPPGAPGQFPLIMLADGNDIRRTAGIVERLVRLGEIRPAILVGLASGQTGIVEDRQELGNSSDIRTLDYIPAAYLQDPASQTRFSDHLDFVADTVLPWARRELGLADDRTSTIVTGQSNGGVFALHAGLQRADVFGMAWPMSIGLGSLEDIRRDGRDLVIPENRFATKFRISAGLYEFSFVLGSRRSVSILREAGYDVDEKWYAAGHSADQWEARLIDNLKAEFPAK